MHLLACVEDGVMLRGDVNSINFHDLVDEFVPLQPISKLQFDVAGFVFCFTNIVQELIAIIFPLDLHDGGLALILDGFSLRN